MGELRKLELDQIVPCPLIPDREDLGDIETLANSVKIKRDVDVPLKVRPSKDGKYERIWGKRRYEAAKYADLKEISCIVEEMSDEETFRQHAVENIHRKDKNPIEEAEFFLAWKERCNVTYETIAADMGLDKPDYVYNRTKLLGLAPTVKKKISTCTNFALRHCLLLTQVKDWDDQEKLADLVEKKGITSVELEKRLRRKEAPPKAEPESVPVPTPPSEPEELPPEPVEPLKAEREAEVVTKPEQFEEVVETAVPEEAVAPKLTEEQINGAVSRLREQIQGLIAAGVSPDRILTCVPQAKPEGGIKEVEAAYDRGWKACETRYQEKFSNTGKERCPACGGQIEVAWTCDSVKKKVVFELFRSSPSHSVRRTWGK